MICIVLDSWGCQRSLIFCLLGVTLNSHFNAFMTPVILYLNINFLVWMIIFVTINLISLHTCMDYSQTGCFQCRILVGETPSVPQSVMDSTIYLLLLRVHKYFKSIKDFIFIECLFIKHYDMISWVIKRGNEKDNKTHSPSYSDKWKHGHVFPMWELYTTYVSENLRWKWLI